MEKNIKDYARKIVHKFYCENDMEFIIENISPSFTWIGSVKSHYIRDYRSSFKFLKNLQGMISSFTIADEYYDIKEITKDTYICNVSLVIYNSKRNKMEQNLTLVFSKLKKKWSWIYLHNFSPYEELMLDEQVDLITKDKSRLSYNYLKQLFVKLGNELKQNEKRILEQSILLDSIYNTVLCGIIRYVRQDDKCQITAMNRAALSMLGYGDIQECMNDGFDGAVSHICEEDRRIIYDKIKLLNNIGDMVEYEYRVKHDDGSIHWIYAKTVFLMKDECGNEIIQRTMTEITDKKELELKLIQEQERYRLAMESSADILYEYNIENDVFTTYQPCIDKKCKDRIIKKNITDYKSKIAQGKFVHPDDIEVIREIIINGKMIPSEVRIILPDTNAYHWYQITGKTIFANAKPIRVVGTLHDIHDMKLEINENAGTAEELQISKNALAAVSDVYSGIYYVNLLRDEYYAVRIPFYLQPSIPKKGIYTKLVGIYLDNLSDTEELSRIEGFMQRDYLLEQLQENNRLEMEYCRTVKDSEQFDWIRMEVNLVSRNKDYPEYITMAFNNITKEKADLEARQYDNTLLGLAISNSYDFIYEYDFNNDLIYNIKSDGSQVVREKCDLKYSEFLYSSALQNIHPEDKERYLFCLSPEKLKHKLFNEKMECYYEFRILNPKTGLYEWMEFTFRSIDRGSLQNIIMFSKSIDERKKKESENFQKEQKSKEVIIEAYEAVSRANEAKSEFLSRMSHDIRTPMNAIIGMTAIAIANLEDREKIKDCLNKINISSKHLLGLINEVLDMSKIESGKICLNDENFNLSDLIQDFLTIVRPEVAKKHQKLNVNISSVDHEYVMGDPLRIQQAFINLMSNAIKYTPEAGTIEIFIREKPFRIKNIGCYEFVFADNGIGMSAEFMPNLFKPFERAEDSRVSKIQGTGLGMAITENIVKMMNGNIEVVSELNKGTKFTVTIYLKLQDIDKENSDVLGDLPILVVDDDLTACENVCLILDELGMKSDRVQSGKLAVAKVVQAHERQEDYFAVIIDWKMPDLDGLATTKLIRSKVGKDVPIIILSAYDWSNIEMEARLAGVDAFICKPLFKSKITHTLQLLISKDDDLLKEKTMDLDQFNLQGRNILLVEDNELNLEIIQEIIGLTKANVYSAVNGQQALDLFIASEPGYYDLIFMDIQMPVMNGHMATRAIRELDRADAKTIPIIAMTANAFSDDIQLSRQSGMNAHLSKPLDLNKLRDILKKWL